MLNLLFVGNLVECCFKLINLLTAPLFVLFFLALFVRWANAFGAWLGLLRSIATAVFRVVSSEVVPIGDGRRLRMYFECCEGSQAMTNSIRSATSSDGLKWTMDPGVRVESEGHNYASPRIVFLDDGRCRMYLFDRGQGIISLLSHDGLEFHPEPGLRIAQDGAYDTLCAFAP